MYIAIQLATKLNHYTNVHNNIHMQFYDTYIHTIFPEDKHPDDNIDDYYHKDRTRYSNYNSSIIVTGTYRISTNAKLHNYVDLQTDIKHIIL